MADRNQSSGRPATMETVSIVVIALLVAVVGREILDPPRVR